MTKLINEFLRPSNASRWLKCPGSIWLEFENGVPLKPEEDYTDEGSMAHAVCEALLKGEVPPNVPDEEMRIHAKGYVEYIENLGLIDMLVEEGLQFTYPFVHVGTADCTGVDSKNPKVLHVIDYKYGAGVTVSPENNPQLIFYAAGALLSRKTEIDNVVLHVYQPRDLNGNVEKTAELSKEMVLNLYNSYVASAVELIDGDNKTLAIGSQCTFCPVKEICPKQKETMDLIVKNTDVLPTPEALDDETLANVILHGSTVKAWIGKVEKHIAERLQSGETIENLYLKDGRSVRKWRDDVDQIKEVLGVFLSEDEFLETKLKTITQVEKNLGGGKAAKEVLSDLVRKTVPGKKPAYGVDPAIDKFDKLKE